MKIAVLGGSFNPVHLGHLCLADEVCTSLGYDKVLFVPAQNPPHKKMNCAVSGMHRMNMLSLALENDSRFEPEDCELSRGGISYTYDTICFLEEKYKGVLEGKIGLIMGHDLLSGFHLWHNASLLAEKCTLILARRPAETEKDGFKNQPEGEYAFVEDSSTFKIQNEKLFKFCVEIKNPVLEISSTDIRRRCSYGESFKYLVGEKVFDYIKKEKLYLEKN